MMVKAQDLTTNTDSYS